MFTRDVTGRLTGDTMSDQILKSQLFFRSEIESDQNQVGLVIWAKMSMKLGLKNFWLHTISCNFASEREREVDCN